MQRVVSNPYIGFRHRSLTFVSSVGVWCGQKEARETIKLLAMLPSDVNAELFDAVLD